MPAIIGFNRDTLAYGMAVSSNDKELLRKRKQENSNLIFVDMYALPRFPSLYEYKEGRAVHTDGYRSQEILLILEEETPKYKTRLRALEYRSLFTQNERILLDKAEARVEGDLSFISKKPVDTQVIGRPAGTTYRDILRTLFLDTKLTGVIDLGSQDSIDNTQALLDLGILDTGARRDAVLLGLQV